MALLLRFALEEADALAVTELEVGILTAAAFASRRILATPSLAS
jgi:hypothetical protein